MTTFKPEINIYDVTLASLEQRRTAAADMIAFHTERLEDLTAQIDAFTAERARLLGEITITGEWEL